MRKETICLAAMAVCLLWVSIAPAESWDLYKDISFKSNPDGPWSFGVLSPFDYSNIKLVPDTKKLTLFDKVRNVSDSSSKWTLSRLTSDFPAFARHSEANDLHPSYAGTDPNNFDWIPRGWVALQPGLQGWKDPNFSTEHPAAVRWTSPITGNVYVSGMFGKGAEGAVGCFIIINNSAVKLAVQNTFSNIPFKFGTDVKAGDTIDFVVTQGTDGSSADMTPLAVSIDTKPLPDDDVWLSSLDILNICSAGLGNKKITPDKNIYGQKLSIGGKVFEKGCGVLAHGIIYIDLNKSVEKFKCYVGVDDAVIPMTPPTEPNLAVKFRILGDGRELYNSGIMKRGDSAKFVDLNVAGINQMILVALPRGLPNYSHCAEGSAADWADARFEHVKEMPQIVLPPMEDRYILTPPAPAKPRINGPKVYGVRPGNPVLFTIPTTGIRPIKFAVQNIPNGLIVDEATGIITGSIEKQGQYRVTLIAENKQGKDQRDFRFIVGDTIALTPPMGWNSWYRYLGDVNDSKMREAAKAMADSGMINYGYSYVNIDDTWMIKPASDDPLLLKGVADINDMQKRVDGYKLKSKCDYAYIPNPRDCNGMINSNDKFPDMKGLADYVHGLGLKIGLYSSPGTLTCAGFIGSFQHEYEDAQRFAQWGFDFLKYDWCNYVASGPDTESLSEMQKPFPIMGHALKSQKRDIVYNLCQYGMAKVWQWGSDVDAHSWRTDTDLGWVINPQSLYCNFTSIAFGQNGLESYAGPGHWNDPDYIVSCDDSGPLKYRISPNEQYTYMSIWAMLNAPLFYSGDMAKLDEFTLNVMCNSEIIAVNQDPLGQQAHRLTLDDDGQVWAKDMEDGSKAVGMFNTTEYETKMSVKFDQLGVKGKCQVRDLWRQKDLGVFNEKFEMSVPRHGAAVIQLFPQK
jgi:alpha-galactosidase